MPTDFSKKSVCLFFEVTQGRSLANKITGKKASIREKDGGLLVSLRMNSSRAPRAPAIAAGLDMAASRGQGKCVSDYKEKWVRTGH